MRYPLKDANPKVPRAQVDIFQSGLISRFVERVTAGCCPFCGSVVIDMKMLYGSGNPQIGSFHSEYALWPGRVPPICPVMHRILTIRGPTSSVLQ